MEENVPATGGKSKKIIIIVIGIIILALAVVTVLENMSQSEVSGLPGKSLSGSGMSFSNSVPSMKSSDMSAQREAAEPVASDESATELTDKKIIKNGDLDLKVNSVDDASQKISAIAKSNGGEVASSNFYQTAANLKSGTVTVKVPVANFEKAFTDLKKIATLVVRESTSGQDVTEQYADLQAQLKNKQAEEQQYLEILKQAQKISDILEVTAQLSQVRGEIERLQGRIKFMDSQTDMSSISISLAEDTNITFADSWRPWQVVKETFNSLVKSVQGFVNFLIVLVIQVIPVLALYLLIFFVIYKIGKKIYLRVKNR
jgi:flagellar basal body-associated protein FliL